MGVRSDLINCSVLLVEDEPLITLDLTNCLEEAGATVLAASSMQEAMRLAESKILSAVVIDFYLSDGDAAPLCHRLSERSVPFAFYSAADQAALSKWQAPVIGKPASHKDILDIVTRLVAGTTDELRARSAPALLHRADAAE